MGHAQLRAARGGPAMRGLWVRRWILLWITLWITCTRGPWTAHGGRLPEVCTECDAILSAGRLRRVSRETIAPKGTSLHRGACGPVDIAIFRLIWPYLAGYRGLASLIQGTRPGRNEREFCGHCTRGPREMRCRAQLGSIHRGTEAVTNHSCTVDKGVHNSCGELSKRVISTRLELTLALPNLGPSRS